MPTTQQDTALSARRRYAQSLLAQGMQATPVQHWSQALARAVQGGIGGYLAHSADEEERSRDKETAALLLGAPGLGGTPQGSEPPLPPPTAGPRSPSMPPVTTMPAATPAPSTATGSMYAGLSGWAPDERPVEPPLREQPLDGMAPRAAGLASLGTAMGGQPPLTGMTPAGAVPVQTQAITPPRQLAQAMAPPPARAPVAIPPQMQTYIKSLIANPKTQAQGLALYQQYSKPQESKYHKLDEDTLFEERTGATRTVGAGRRSLITPEERAQFGIPADDKRPYQVGPNNRLINPPPETRVSIDQRGESKFSEKAGGLIADRFNDYVKSGDEARGVVADLDSLREIGSRITTGKTAEITNALGPWAEALGIKIDGLGDMQAYRAVVAKMAPRMRPPGAGATSDFDARQYLEALPGLGKTPEGNEIIANTNQSLLAHRQAVAEIASKAMAGEMSPREAEKMIRELPDPMALWKKTRGKSPAATVTPGTYNWTPNGLEPVK